MAIELLYKLAKQDDVEGDNPAVVVCKQQAGMVTRRILAVQNCEWTGDTHVICHPVTFGTSCQSKEVPNGMLLSDTIRKPGDMINKVPDGYGVPFVMDSEVIAVLTKMMAEVGAVSVKFEPVYEGEPIPFICVDMDGVIVLSGLLSPFKPKDEPPTGDDVRAILRDFIV